MNENEINTQECVDLLLELPLATLVDAQTGALASRLCGEGRWGTWSDEDQLISDLIDTMIAYRIDEGLTL